MSFQNVEVKVKGFLRTALSAEASTTTIDIDWIDEDNPSTVITPQSDSLMFEIDPLNTTGKGSEICLGTSLATDTPSSGRTRYSTVTRGLLKYGAATTGSAARAKSWDVGTPVAIATGTMAKQVNKLTSEMNTLYPTNGQAVKHPTYADATARDAAITSPANGMTIYNTGAGTLQQYVGGSWADVGDTGTPNASTTVAGKFEEATVAEQGSATATGGTGARLVPANANLVKTSSGAGDENKIAILDSDGQYAAGFLSKAGITGEIKMWSTTSAPTGWLLCDGSAVSRTTYASLFGVISDTFGGGDGSTTFNVPNFKSRLPIGVETALKNVIDDCESAWTAGSNVVASNDAVIFKTGSNSVKLAVAAGAGAGQILGYKAISSTDFTGKPTVGFWFRSSIALNAGDLKYQLDDTAALASPIESIDLPAISANVWTKVYLRLSTPASCTAIVSHGLYQVNDKGAFDLYIDDIANGENYELGAKGGAKTYTLATTEMPSHYHVNDLSNTGTGGTGNIASNSGGGTTSTRNTQNTGGGLAHSLLNPYLSINFIIKT